MTSLFGGLNNEDRVPAFRLLAFLLPCLALAYDYSPKTPLPSPDECLRILKEGNARFTQGIRQVHAKMSITKDEDVK